MDFSRWFKPKPKPEETAVPSTRVRSVSIEDHQIVCHWEAGEKRRIQLGNVNRVLIRTTDQGPFDEDVFFVLNASGGEYIIPQGAHGTNNLIKLLQSLDGFDQQAVVSAMISTENREFHCWPRENNDPPESPFSRLPDF